MVYFESNYLHVEYHAATRVLISQWYGGCSSLQYRQALITGMRLSKKLGAHYLVVDERLQPPLTEDDHNWTRDIYISAFHKLPLKKFAIVNAFSIMKEQQQKVFLQQNASLPFETRTFDDLTSAYEWLTSSSGE